MTAVSFLPAMRKFVNHPKEFVHEMMEGLVLASPDTLAWKPEFNIIHRADAPQDNKVSIIQGSGSGHEPLRVGTFVTADIAGRAGGELFPIPRHALSQGSRIWVVDEDRRIRPRDVTIVRSDERFAYVSAGLEEADRYVTTPIDQPLPGMRVRLSDD